MCKIVEKRVERFQMRLFDDEKIEAQALCLQYNLSYEQLFVKLIKEHIILKMRDVEGGSFEKLKIELTEKNERIFREMHQFVPSDYSFEKFINSWIENELMKAGFE